MTHLLSAHPSQRAYVGVLTAMIRNDTDKHFEIGCRSVVARYLRDLSTRELVMDSQLVLIGGSYGDPLPIHCFIRHDRGHRLVDSNRVCIIRDRIYEWTNAEQVTTRGVVLASVPVRHLLGDIMLLQAIEERRKLRHRRSYDVK